MLNPTRHVLSRTIYLLIASSGFATLSWEVIWQIKSTLALGVSAWGAAITLAIVMGGMSLGGFLMGKALGHGSPMQAIHLYGLLEVIAGLAGCFLNTAMRLLESIDTWAYTELPGSLSLISILGMIVVFSLPTLCMGATFPVFGLITKQYQVSMATLYSLNTLGAALGVLMVALVLIPSFGITHTINIIAAINILIGLFAWLLFPSRQLTSTIAPVTEQPTFQPFSSNILFIVFVTGFATFTLEIAWFRSFESVFANTTDVFAIMLACVLIALGLAARKVPVLKQKKKRLGTQIGMAGILILLITPLIERLDNIFAYSKQAAANHAAAMHGEWASNPDTFIVSWVAVLFYVFLLLVRFFAIYFIIVPPIRFLGMAFPWIIDNQHASPLMGKLYALNTLAAIVGSISAAWLLLPTIGFAKTAWFAGALVIIAGISITPGRKRYVLAVLGIAALLTAIYFETGIGSIRAQGYFATDNEGKPANVLAFFEGPEATVSAVQYEDGARALLINSTLAAWESGHTYKPSAHYMAWMGHLPMLLQPHPKKALVICFGTGQTANAVRKENPDELDIVDINANVFKLAHYFRANEGVLTDPRVKTIVMDGRAYMRRSKKSYDVITLEPMPPNTTGVNALYSKEFYELARKRLEPKGVIAQWLPFHLVSSHYTASIVKTFIDVFPNAILWIDPDSKTGILLGTKEADSTLANHWPGFARNAITRNLTADEIKHYVALNRNELQQYSRHGEIISDDNQLLAYGKVLYPSALLEDNFARLHRINPKITVPHIGPNFQ
jgi:spermidine synthase